MKQLITIALLSIILILTGCGNPATVTTQPPIAQQTPLFKVAHALNEIDQTDKQLVISIISSNAQGLINDNTTRTILGIADRLAKATDQANVVTRGLATLPPGVAINVWGILKPVSDSVSQAITTGLVPITNADTKTAILTLLTTIQTSLAVVQAQAGGN